MKTLNQIKDLQKVAVQEILNDDSSSRYSKLEAIEDNNLWETKSWIQHPFKDGPYGKTFLEELKANPEENGYVCTIIDDIMSNGIEHRGQKVCLSWFFEEDHAEDYDTPEEYDKYLNSKITILTSRGRSVRKMEITNKEFLDYLWDWAITNKCSSWHFDW